MHASVRVEIACRLLGGSLSVEAPDSLLGRVRITLGRLPALPGDTPAGARLPLEPAPGEGSLAIRLAPSAAGWNVELAGRRSSACNEEEAVICLQEMLLESATSRAGDYLLFRGSIVARGSQSVLVLGGRGSTDAIVAIALTSLGFRLVSVGTAAFERRSLMPLPLPLTFALGPQERQLLEEAGLSYSEQAEALSEHLFAPHTVCAAPEPTHVLFPEAHSGGLSLVRPVAASAARARLCQAMLSAPADGSPFTAVASLLRHTRGIHLALGDLTRALEQLSRLLPRWSVD